MVTWASSQESLSLGFLTRTEVIPKPACSATETSLKIEISFVASLDIILANKRITKELIRLRGCAVWGAPLLFANTEERFSCVKVHMINSI